MIHALKCWPSYFEEVLSGRKRFEVRRDDRPRPYAVGDQLDLVEHDPTTGRTGRAVRVNVDFVLRAPEPSGGLRRGWVVMGISR